MSTNKSVQSSAQKTRGGACFPGDLMAAIEFHEKEGLKTSQIYKFDYGTTAYYIVATNRYQAAELALEQFFSDLGEKFTLKLVSRQELVRSLQAAAKLAAQSGESSGK